jgi:hypothetical protein
MSGLELLQKHPITAELIRTWFLRQMFESFKDQDVPTEFKDFMREQGVDNDKVAKMIDINPRMLLDVFDENDVVIETSLYPNGEFTIKIGNEATTNSWKTRKEAELFAIDAAFQILEDRLGEERMTVIAQNGNTGEHYDNETSEEEEK